MRYTARDAIAMCFVPGLGPVKALRLLDGIKSLDALDDLTDLELAELMGAGLKNTHLLRSARNNRKYLEELDFIENNGIKTSTLCDGDYPVLLREIHDPPTVLFIKGDITERDDTAVAIIGSRKCSVYGMRIAEKLAMDLAYAGVTVVSGMARGIDSAAHRGALKAGGRTIAIMGSGFGYIYPPGSESLADMISSNGAVVTEYVSGTEPLKGNFPRRNRLISGISKAVVVVEAGMKSGAMITVDLALEQNRDVMAVPGMADSFYSRGTNYLIKNGARLVTSAADIFEEIDVPVRNVPDTAADDRSCSRKNEKPLEADEKKIFDLLKVKNHMHIDKIGENSGILNGVLHNVLLNMELKGIITAEPGKKYALK